MQLKHKSSQMTLLHLIFGRESAWPAGGIEWGIKKIRMTVALWDDEFVEVKGGSILRQILVCDLGPSSNLQCCPLLE